MFQYCFHHIHKLIELFLLSDLHFLANFQQSVQLNLLPNRLFLRWLIKSNRLFVTGQFKGADHSYMEVNRVVARKQLTQYLLWRVRS